MKTLSCKLSFSELQVQVEQIGEDLCLLLRGGERPHIGCAVLAVPRPSLRADGSLSCTSSVLNLPGHKDEALCRLLAERACKQSGKTCLCTGGFHVDDMNPSQIEEVIQAVEKLHLEMITE